jgi:type II secretory pathway pseudopilin PulG
MNRNRTNSGYTIQELLVALVISSLIAGMSYQLYLSAQQVVYHWTRVDEARLQRLMATHRFGWDLERALIVRSATDSVLVLSLAGGRTVEYRTRDSVLVRNGEPLVSRSVDRISVQNRPEGYAEVSLLEGRGQSVLRRAFRPTARQRFLLAVKEDFP